MPIKRLTCPHCEQAVEIQVTSVTRSRPCPSCGQTVFLQVAEKEKRVRRKALLMPTEEVTDLTGVPGPVGGAVSHLPYPPQVLEGDAFERMKTDPELVRYKKTFLTGVVLVAVLAGGLTVHHFYSAHRDRRAAEELEGLIGSLEMEAEKGRLGHGGAADEVKPGAPNAQASGPRPSGGLKIAGADAIPAAEVPVGRRVDFQNPVEVVGAFLKAASVDERLLYVLSPAVMEKKMRRYHQRVPDGPFEFRKVTDVGAEASDIKKFEVVLSDYSVRVAYALLGPDGYRIDWGSFVLYSDLTFDELRSIKPSDPVMVRVLVKEGKRFEGVFNDPNWLRCLEIRAADQPEADVLYAYVEKNSALGGEVDYWLRTYPDALQGWTVAVRYPIDAVEHSQVWLDTLISTEWLAVKRLK